MSDFLTTLPWSAHSKASMAQIIFYVLAIMPAGFLLFHLHSRPRAFPPMAWLVIFILCIIKITGGIVMILYDSFDTPELMTAAIILLNIGVFSLLVATSYLIQIITTREQERNLLIRLGFMLSDIFVFAGTASTIAAEYYLGNYWSSYCWADSPNCVPDMSTILKLLQAACIIVAVPVPILLAIQIYLWTQYFQLSSTSRTILRSMAMAMPLMIVRIVYLFLPVFRPSDPTWSNLNGSIVAFVLMGMLMEFALVFIYLLTGFAIPPAWRGQKTPGATSRDPQIVDQPD